MTNDRKPRASASRNTHRKAAELLRQSLPSGNVLDIPCGEGAFTKELVAAGYKTYAADIAQINRIQRAAFIGCDMNQPLPFPDGYFDAVVCIEGIEHIERPFDFVAECHRILREGGILILSTPNISALRSRWRWFLTGFHNKRKVPLDETRPAYRHHVNLMALPDLRYMLHTKNFQIDCVRSNRVKAASWLYAPFVPVCALTTASAFLRWEKDPAQRARNWEIFKQLFSIPTLFCETLIVRARAHKLSRKQASAFHR